MNLVKRLKIYLEAIGSAGRLLSIEKLGYLRQGERLKKFMSEVVDAYTARNQAKELSRRTY